MIATLKVNSSKRAEQERTKETKSKILNVAIEEFSSSCYDGVSARSIAAKADVNHTLITHHFGSKLDLWKASAKVIFDTYISESDKRRSEIGEVDERILIRELIQHYIEFSAHYPYFYRFMIQANQGNPDRINWFTDNYIGPNARSELNLLKLAQKYGLMPKGDSIHIRYIFIGAVNSIFIYAPQFYRISGKDPYCDKVIEQHIDYVMSIFGTKNIN